MIIKALKEPAMKAFFLILLTTIALNIISCATTPTQGENAKNLQLEQEMEQVQPPAR
jgi:hypothetical protein